MPRVTFWTRLLFLALTLTVASGYRFRCYWFCIDQTSTQDDYVEQRDQCRQYAQVKYDAMIAGSESAGSESRDTALVRLFAECMAQHGWQVPGLGEAAAATPMAPTTPMGSSTTKTSETKTTTTTTTSLAAGTGYAPNDKAAFTRHAECEFARANASVSRIAAERAEACDEECRNALAANPNGPLPAACAANTPRPSATASTTTTRQTKTIIAAAPPEEKPKPKHVAHHAVKKPKPVAVPVQPAPKPQPKPSPVAPPPSPVYPPNPVPVVQPPSPPVPAENTSEASLLSGLLGADLMLFFILLAIYLALRLARRHKPQTPRREPSLSAKIRKRSENE